MVSASSDSKKNVMLALGAGLALIGAAVVYSLLKNDGGEEGSGESIDTEVPKPDYDEIE